MKLIWQWKNLKYDYFFSFFFCFYHPEKNFSEGVVFSCVCDFVLFYFIFSATTITLERLNQSEPNFHTRLLSEIAWPCTKMGFCLPLKIDTSNFNQSKKKKKKFSHMTFDWNSSSVRKWASKVKCNPPNWGLLPPGKFNFFFFFCCHDNSWKAQPIRTKFSHRLLTEIAQSYTKMGSAGHK